jgi:hypothetical protein
VTLELLDQASPPSFRDRAFHDAAGDRVDEDAARKTSSTGLYGRRVEPDDQERQLNIHLDPEHLAGVYANFANVSFSAYEFTVTFARIDHEVEQGDVPGVVVARVNMSPRFMEELMGAMQDTWSKWRTTEGIRNLPEIPPDEG